MDPRNDKEANLMKQKQNTRESSGDAQDQEPPRRRVVLTPRLAARVRLMTFPILPIDPRPRRSSSF